LAIRHPRPFDKLRANGERVSPRRYSYIERRLWRDTANQLFAYHGYFKIAEDEQGRDHGKRIFAKTLQICQRLGVKWIDLDANIDMGGYVWARYGFVIRPFDKLRANGEPTEWPSLRQALLHKLENLVAGSPEAAVAEARRLLAADDPYSILDLAQLPGLGKALLRGSRWDGRFVM
jgi:GNAT superfamily N-acetyltransferase